MGADALPRYASITLGLCCTDRATFGDLGPVVEHGDVVGHPITIFMSCSIRRIVRLRSGDLHRTNCVTFGLARVHPAVARRAQQLRFAASAREISTALIAIGRFRAVTSANRPRST